MSHRCSFGPEKWLISYKEMQEVEGRTAIQKRVAILGLLFLAMSYMQWLHRQRIRSLLAYIFFLPPLATVGTFYFFTDSLPLLLHKLRNRKRLYWHHFWLLSISEGVVRLRENARMFFIVTIVSTVAFMSVGILASLTSFASQYQEMHPLGLVYKSESENELERKHITQLVDELNAERIDYSLVRFQVLEQTSTFTKNTVAILKLSNVNILAHSFGYQAIDMEKGEAVFLPPSASSYDQLKNRTVTTLLKESNVNVTIDGAYPYHLFSAYSIATNAIVLNDTDYEYGLRKWIHSKGKVIFLLCIQCSRLAKNKGNRLIHRC